MGWGGGRVRNPEKSLSKHQTLARKDLYFDLFMMAMKKTRPGEMAESERERD